MIKARSTPIWAPCACLLLITMMCSPAKEAVKESVKEAVDTSTVDNWQTNCALFHEYHNELIFSAAETTTSDGKRVVAWAARDRAGYLAVF